jgi:hypothetical protein
MSASGRVARLEADTVSFGANSKETQTMRYMILIKATLDSEAGVMPGEDMLKTMADYHEQLAKAGVLVDGNGLKPSAEGWRIEWKAGRKLVVDGPFAETKELIAGFWLMQARSLAEVIEWVKRAPNPHEEETEVEIRPVFEAEDFGEEFTPELRKREERLRMRLDGERGEAS